MNNGYRGMLRDRVPKVVDYALKWCKAKERWIEHVYTNSIQFYANNKDRRNATKVSLGIRKGKPKNFDFHKSIMWDQFGLSKDEKDYWIWVEGWVNWFRKVYWGIENSYEISQKVGKYNKAEFKKELENTYLKNVDESQKEKLAEFIIACLDKKI